MDLTNIPEKMLRPDYAFQARDFADPLGKDRGVLDPMPVAVDDGVRETLADFFGRVVCAHLAPPPTGEVRFRASVCSQHNPSQTAVPSAGVRVRHLMSS